MSTFKDMVAADNCSVFLNADEFADRRTVIYDEETYADIPVVLTRNAEKDREQGTSDHMQGLYLVSKIMHCALSDLGGNRPEKGAKIQVDDETGFFHTYYVAESNAEEGMLRVELEAVDE